MEVIATTIDGSNSMTIAIGTSVWSVVGVPIPWGRRLVLPLLLLLLFLLLLLLLLYLRVCVCVCVCLCVCVCFKNGRLNN